MNKKTVFSVKKLQIFLNIQIGRAWCYFVEKDSDENKTSFNNLHE